MHNFKDLLLSPSTSILDVRTEQEFSAEHINGAKNIPLTDLPYRLQEIKEMSQPIVVYCLSGGRSSMAVNVLKQQGIEEVYNGGGISQLKQILNN
jgi:rhodanese-related sulfurtransferase